MSKEDKKKPVEGQEDFILKKIRYYQGTIKDYDDFWNQKINQGVSEESPETKSFVKRNAELNKAFEIIPVEKDDTVMCTDVPAGEQGEQGVELPKAEKTSEDGDEKKEKKEKKEEKHEEEEEVKVKDEKKEEKGEEEEEEKVKDAKKEEKGDDDDDDKKKKKKENDD